MHLASTLGVTAEANLQRTYSEPSLDPPWQGSHLLSYTPKAQKQGATFEKKEAPISAICSLHSVFLFVDSNSALS